MKIISATVEIGAPPMTVWAIITDLGRYREWNPLFREASGEVAVGNTITLHSVHPANGRMMTVKPKIIVAEPGVELRWTAGLPGIIGGEHSFALTPRNRGTQLVQSESFRGLLWPFSRRTMANTSTGFRELNEALKTRAEAG
jgi:hypothetical protein